MCRYIDQTQVILVTVCVNKKAKNYYNKHKKESLLSCCIHSKGNMSGDMGNLSAYDTA